MRDDALKILKDRHPIIKKLKDESIVHFSSNDEIFHGECWIVENCDRWFSYKLTKEDCLGLSSFFDDLSKIIK